MSESLTIRGTIFTELTSETNEMNTNDRMNSKEDNLGAEYTQDNLYNPTSSIIDDIEIKHEELDFHHNSISHSDSDCNSNLGTVSNILHLDCGSDRTEEKYVNDFYLDFLHCERGCETCQKYLTLLSEHVQAFHAPPQSIQDPLHIDPVDINIDPDSPHSHQSSSVQVKIEVGEDIEKMGYSEQDSEDTHKSDPDFEIESGGKSDPDYSPSISLKRNQIVRRGHLAKNYKSNDSITSKVKKGIPLSQEHLRCSECGKSFKTMYILRVHMRTHTGEKPFKCDVCDKSFSQKVSLTIHQAVHTGLKSFKCDQCEKSYTVQASLTKHMRIHTGERPYKCDVCEESFPRSDQLSTHMRRHTGEKPYECTVCEKSLSHKTSLIQHIRVHTGEKPFKCDVCEKSFKGSSVFARHKRIHTGERPYKCEECEKSFSRSEQLTTHKRCHTNRK